ncbi:hypothetical protein MFLAVUS_007079 [Mucor flavus]|uniref:Uncharacterized protein n=1 Tax=Mucor flavus TaxID=439312 RepID=A0ABP9Z3B1_9FUNG
MTLAFRGCWTTIEPEDWDLTDYDMKYLEKRDITKQLSHSEITKDMAVLIDALPDDELVKIAIPKIRESLKVYYRARSK